MNRSYAAAPTSNPTARESTHPEAVVVGLNTEKGYGFIAPAAGGSHDVFVHFTSIVGDGRRSLAEGQRVSYEVVANPRHGATAEQVRVLPG